MNECKCNFGNKLFRTICSASWVVKYCSLLDCSAKLANNTLLRNGYSGSTRDALMISSCDPTGNISATSDP